jgi:hypothetical protein
MEAGKVVVAPPPSGDCSVLLVYPAPWAWDDVFEAPSTVVDADAYEDVLTYGEWRGGAAKAASLSRVRQVTRIGQSTTFSDASAEKGSAEEARLRWERRVVRARVGPVR